jgi:hypothetical protein
LARLERYELDVFAEQDPPPLEEPIAMSAAAGDVALERAAGRAGRRKAAAQASLFDLANQKVVEEIRTAADSLSGDEAKDLLKRLKDQLL